MGTEAPIEREVRLRSCPTCSSEPLTKPRLVDEPAEGIGERGRVAGRNEQSRLSLDDELGESADSRRNDGQAGRHRLENGEWEGLRPAGKDEDVGLGQDLGDIVALSHELDDLLHTEPPYLGFDRRAFWPLSHHESREIALPKVSEGPHERDRVLGGLEPPDADDPRHLSCRPGHRSPGDVDPVPDHDSRARIARPRLDPRCPLEAETHTVAVVSGRTSRSAHRYMGTALPLAALNAQP